MELPKKNRAFSTFNCIKVNKKNHINSYSQHRIHQKEENLLINNSNILLTFKWQ